MLIDQSLSSLVRRQDARWIKSGEFSLLSAKHTWLRAPGVILIASMLLLITTACSGLNIVNGGTATPGPVSTSSIHWCGKPLAIFRDEAAPTAPTPGATPTPATSLNPADGVPKTITDWKVVKANLGFTVFLPATLPAGTCLTSAASTLRDPIIGSNFTIGYLLPNHDAISLSEAPLRSQKNAAFQCSVSVNAPGVSGAPTPTTTAGQDPVQLCTGGRDMTDIVFSARGSTSNLQKFFLAMQPNINWLPAS
ncbi:MAG TPA: hypothetical protein VFB60_18865 [Ktedonobacteraceae bacterium]|nr:hypothetical protein [Ktedonobacteraceae bacterium]